MKRLLPLVTCLAIYLAIPFPGLLGQLQGQTPSPVTQVNFVTDPAPIPGISAGYSGPAGGIQYCYWLIASFTGGGNSPSSAPACVESSGLSSQNPVIVTWNRMSDVTQYYVLRTTNGTFSGSCVNCLLTSTSGTGFVDDGSVIPGSFTLTGVVGVSSGSLFLNNITFPQPLYSFSPRISPQSLGSGVPSSGNFLRGDGRWEVAGGGSSAPDDAEYWLGTANGDLGNGIVVNDLATLEAAVGGYDFSDAANLTGDIAAGRMSTNWGTAGTSACATSGGVMFDNGSAVGCASGFTIDGTNLRIPSSGLRLGASADTGFMALASDTVVDLRISANTRYRLNNSPTILDIYPAAGAGGFRVDDGANKAFFGKANSGGNSTFGGTAHAAHVGTTGATPVEVFVNSVRVAAFGGSQTALVQDQTPTTGATKAIIKAGEGQGSTNLTEWRDNADAVMASVGSDGALHLPYVQIEDPGTRPTCDADARGTIWVDEGGAGVADDASICLKNAADAYAWAAIASP